MRPSTFLGILVLLLRASVFCQQAEVPAPASSLAVPPGMEAIDKAELLSHATFLSSDDLGGRYTGSPGQQKAAEFITKHFQDLGLEPLGDTVDGKATYEQRYPLIRSFLDPKTSQVQIGEAIHKDGFSLLMDDGKKSQLDAQGVLIYGGYTGRYGERMSWRSLYGRIPVVFVEKPRLNKPLPVQLQFSAVYALLNFRLLPKVENMARVGADAVLVCFLDDNSPLSSVLSYLCLAPGQDMMSDPESHSRDLASHFKASIPMVFVSREISLELLKALNMTEDQVVHGEEEAQAEEPKKPKKEKEEDPEAKPALPPQVKAHLRMQVNKDEHAFGTNVCALLRGSDPDLQQEAVIFTAHMDHVGKRLDGEIFNGADDNASGSAGLMEIAQAFSKAAADAGTAPRRSIIFLSVSGEEEGLWGSAHYAAHPTWPLDKIIANVNTDMIGRSGPESTANEITVTPSFQHVQYSTLVQDAARLGTQLGVSLTNGDKYYERSDHYNFAREGIPVVFFCCGEHEDYHQVTDTADKLDGDKMQKVTRLAYWLGYQTAQAAATPQRLGPQKSWLPEAKSTPEPKPEPSTESQPKPKPSTEPQPTGEAR